jgi:hypothetical protein
MKSRAKQKASRNQKSRTTTRQPRNDKEQSKLFIKTAREIGADEEHSATDKLMERLVKTKPEPRKGQG